MNWHLLPASERERYLPAVWSMYLNAYSSIGLPTSNPRQILDEFDHWWILLDVQGQPRAFRAGKTTPYGVKLSMSGTDGSRLAKRATVATIAAWFREPGIYGEVSHRLEEFASQGNAPTVCATEAKRVLGKSITPTGDGIHYVREITGVGPVQKVMVGRPFSVPTTTYGNPQCPLGALAGYGDLVDRLADADSHAPWLDV